MDGPPEAGGRDLGIRPMEMLLLGLGGCASFDVVMILQKAKQDLVDCEVEISARRADSLPKVFTDIHLHFVVKGNNLSSERVKRAIALSAEKYCSASLMLGKTATITHDFEVINV
jgi:putative redox protein